MILLKYSRLNLICELKVISSVPVSKSFPQFLEHRSTLAFDESILKTFKDQVNLLVRYERAMLGNHAITRYLRKAYMIRQKFGLFGKYPVQLETVYAVRELFYRTILKISKRPGPLSTGPQYGAQLFHSEQLLATSSKKKPIEKISSSVAQIFSANLTNEEKRNALLHLIEEQTALHVHQFLIDNLDCVIDRLQSPASFEELSPLLNVYLVDAHLLEMIRNHIKDPRLSSLEKRAICIQYLFQSTKSLHASFQNTVSKILNVKYLNVVLNYFKSRSDHLIDLMIFSRRKIQLNSLDIRFLNEEQIRSFRANYGAEIPLIRRQFLAIAYLIEQIARSDSFLFIKQELLNILHEKKDRIQRRKHLDGLVDSIVRGFQIEQALLDLFSLTLEQVQSIQNDIFKEAPYLDHLTQEQALEASETFLRVKKITVMQRLISIFSHSFLPPELQRDVTKRLRSKIAICEAKPLYFREELQSLVEFMRSPQFSKKDEKSSRDLARKYGFNPENISVLRGFSEVVSQARAEYLFRLGIDELERLISLIENTLTDENLLHQYGLTEEDFQSIRKKMKDQEIDPSEIRLFIIRSLITLPSFRQAVFQNHQELFHSVIVKNHLTIDQILEQKKDELLKDTLIDLINKGDLSHVEKKVSTHILQDAFK